MVKERMRDEEVIVKVVERGEEEKMMIKRRKDKMRKN